MRNLGFIFAVIAFAAAIYFSRGQSDRDAIPVDLGTQKPLVAVSLPATMSALAITGAAQFNMNCASCHGLNGAGNDGFGPPLVHKIYEPNHHGDIAFVLAAAQGVRAHHWNFGDMPPQPQITEADITAIIAFVRELQAENGIN